jgi:hypothetical protein
MEKVSVRINATVRNISMRKPIVAAWVAVLALVAAAAYYLLEVFPQHQFRAGLDQALASLPPGTTAAYKEAHYSPVSHQAVVTGVTMHGEIAGNPPQPFDVAIDSIEITNPNLDLPNSWASAAVNPASVSPDAMIAVANSIVIKGVTIHSAMINATEDYAQIINPSLHPWGLLHAGMPSWNDIRGSLMTGSQLRSIADLQPLLHAEAAVVLGFGYDSYEVGSLKATETFPGVDLAFDVGKITGSGFDRGVIKGGTAETITVTGPKLGAFSVDRVVIGPTDIREPLTRIVNGEALSPAMLNGMHFGRIEYNGITAQPPGMAATHMGAFSLGPTAFEQGIPVSGELAWTDISVSRNQMPDAESQDAFDKLGLETMTVSFAATYDWDVAQQHASVHDTMLKVNELGTVTLAADLTNLFPNVAAISLGRLAHARFRFENASLVERLLRIGAAQSGIDPAAYRAQIASAALQQSIAIGGGNPMILAAGQSVADFVNSPHSLTIELSPPAPVPFLALQRAAADPAALATMIGLSVIANQP